MACVPDPSGQNILVCDPCARWWRTQMPIIEEEGERFTGYRYCLMLTTL